MRFLVLVIALWATAAIGATSDAAAPEQVVVVTYNKEKAAKFVDPGDAPREIEANIKTLTRHLQGLGQRALAPGQRLQIEIVELDLAGRLSSSARVGQRVRVINGAADWPRIDLRYVLSGPTGELRRGEESLSDQNYMVHPLRNTDEPLRYEQRLLTQWFESRFGAAASAPAKR
ncbi:MAG TPA: DUF3016 domain-containing protein [Rhizobacter sp.]|nr:DUF3016 domain-containing protein [Rhizobacter sp.]